MTDYNLLCTLKSLVNICLLHVYFHFSLHLGSKMKPMSPLVHVNYSRLDYVLPGDYMVSANIDRVPSRHRAACPCGSGVQVTIL